MCGRTNPVQVIRKWQFNTKIFKTAFWSLIDCTLVISFKDIPILKNTEKYCSHQIEIHKENRYELLVSCDQTLALIQIRYPKSNELYTLYQRCCYFLQTREYYYSTLIKILSKGRGYMNADIESDRSRVKTSTYLQIGWAKSYTLVPNTFYEIEALFPLSMITHCTSVEDP